MNTTGVGRKKVELEVKNPPANAEEVRDVGSIPRSGRFPGVGNPEWQPIQHSCPENSQGQRNLVGYHP